jgi:hypothetical protein
MQTNKRTGKIYLKNMRIIALCYLLLTSTFSLYSQEKRLSFYLDSNKHIIVNYTIKGEKVKLLLDTGWEGEMLDVHIADKLNILPHKENRTVKMYTASGEPYIVITTDKGTNNFIDTLFNYPWSLSDMKQTAKSLKFDEDVNGIVGINFIDYKYVVEFDFKHKQLVFWDSLPKNYFKKKKVYQANLLSSNYLQVGKYSKINAQFPNIKGVLTMLDTVTIHPLFFFDTGSIGAEFTLQIYTEELLGKLLEYKRLITQKHGPDYPTTRFELPELGIDTLYSNCNVTRVMYDAFGHYKDTKLRVLLGMDFFLQYEKVIFDIKNGTGYFIKE